MATLIKNPPRNKGSKKPRKKAPLSPQQRFKQRLLYKLRHPVDTAWGWLSSVRTAILLISAIAAVSLIGIYFVQAPGEVLDDPVAYAGWVQQNALPRYGSVTPFYYSLHVFTVVSR